MKYVVALVVGLLAGAALAAALIYFNPLTRSQAEPRDGAGWSFGYSLAAAETWLSTHDDRLDLPLVPEGVELLWEGGIKGTLLAAMPLSGGPGAGGAAASRISVPSPATELLRAGVVVDDHWLISIPGQGSFFVHSVSNQWPLLRDTVVRVDWLRQGFTGGRYSPTRGPEAAGASVFGLTGELGGRRGRGRERVSLERYSGSLAELRGELVLDVAAASP